MCADSPTGSLYLLDRENVAIPTTIDSGAEINSIDPGEGFQIKRKVTLHAKVNDRKMRIKAYVLPLRHKSILLGMLWLRNFQPDIDWKTQKIRGWKDAESIPRAPHMEGAVRKTTISTELEVKASAGKEEVKLLELYQDFEEKGHIYPMSQDEMKALRDFIDENLKCGKIRESKSDQATPVFFIGKKDGKCRLIQDYRHLNKHTVDDSYPLPNVQQLIDELCESRYYAKFDIRWGFTNIHVKDSDIWKGAFVTPLGLFEPLVMFFGQKNSPPTFQWYMDVTFRKQLMKRQQVGYMDNVVVHAKTHEELCRQVHEFLECVFKAEEVEFLGYIIGEGRIKTHAVKTDAIKEWKEPKNLMQLRSFLGFTNFYRKFITGYSTVSTPLHHLSKKDILWKWEQEQQDAFDKLKRMLSVSPVLNIPDPMKLFALFTNASQSATGMVLAQKGEDDEWHPCSYLSESLKGAEKNYLVYDLEFLAVIRTIKAFQHYLISPVAPTIVFTDHKNLEYYKEPQKFSQWQTRWFSYVQGFPLKFSYTLGRLMMAPDALSRCSDHTPPEPVVATLLPPSVWLEGGVKPTVPTVSLLKTALISAKPTSLPTEDSPKERKCGIYALSAEVYECAKSETKKDSTLSAEITEITNHPDGTKRRKNRVYIPPGACKECLLSYHDHPSAGHPGIKAMTRKMVKDVWWPGMWKYIQDYVKGCAVCQSAKVITHPVTPPVVPNDVPKNPFPFQQILMDLITDLPVSNTFDTVLTIVNQGLTKAAMFIPCRKDVDSLGIAQLFHKHVYSRFGLPEAVISDRGLQFASTFTHELYKSLGVQSKLSTAYHPQTNGESECVNQELEMYLRCYCAEHPNSWSSKLPDAEFAHNSHIHSIHQQMPYSLLYGYDPSPYPEVWLTSAPSVDERLERLASCHDNAILAHKAVQEVMKCRSKGSYVPFKEGNRVWLNSGNLCVQGQSPKVTPRCFGPFEIERVISPVAVRLHLPDTWHVHPVFHTGRLLPYHETAEYGIPDLPLPPEVVDDKVEWEVESILNHKNTGRGHQAHRTYLVKWKGFTHMDNSWEPESSLKDHADELLEHYDAPLNTRPYALFDASSDDPAPSPSLSSISSQVDLSSLDSFDEIPLPRSFPSQSFSIRRVPVTRGQLGKGRQTEWPSPLHQSILFTDGSHPGGVSAASACSTHGRELGSPSSSSTLEVPQIRVIPAELPPLPTQEHESVPNYGHLVPASPNYLNYVWTLAIYDGRYPLDGKTEEQNDCLRLLSEIYRGTDIVLDRVPKLLHQSRTITVDSIASSIDRLLSDLTINVSALQYRLALETALLLSPEECRSFRNREVDRYKEAKVRDGASDDTAATAGSTMGQECPDVTMKIEEAELDPWSTELIEFTADDGYSKKRDASFSETAKFLSESTAHATSSFFWRQFLDSAAWNKADHALHNAINMTTPLPATTFHPIVMDGMLRLYLASHAPIPLAHPLYQYACYDCCYFRHWSCHNGHGSRWTPAANLPAEDDNEGSHQSSARPLHSHRRCSLTPRPSVNPGQSGVRRA
ncbi:hypothetical protein PISMIDRAFT_17930 [Pisolithus microcarpus 441]|uniref:Reverse transcriptase n=1 Tax=Pisolithus microcarpus 441 TaxID=765257 RepID=A0A0C9YTD1_9AGAM|nr:hypothetical protein PISMIDRAFT_17930 [Pisolithus microcarpus 441]